MSPDFEYFLRGRPQGTFGHSLPGLLLFCLPLSIAVVLIFERVCKRPVLLLLPIWFRSRISGSVTPLSRFGIVAVCIVFGAVTHILWDSFTHPFGAAVQSLPALSQPAIAQVPLFRVLQHLSTVLGVTAVGLVGYANLRRREPHSATRPELPNVVRSLFWVTLCVVATAAFIRPFWSATSLRPAAAVAVVQSIDAALVVIVLFSVALQLRFQHDPSMAG